MIWFLEGQSSQREVILASKRALPASTKVYASHSGDRKEITSCADVSLIEPKELNERIEWVIDTAVENDIRVVHAGKNVASYEERRGDFEKKGITLVTGVLSTDQLRIESKAVFTQECTTAGLSVVPGRAVCTADELIQAYLTLSETGPVCVKPVMGIYGAGFWRFDDTSDPFSCVAYPDNRRIAFSTYLEIFKASKKLQHVLVMPHMPGDEVSVDIVVESGNPIAWVGRRKKGLYQYFENRGAAVELALNAVIHFGLDGIVSVQTKDDADGKPHLLEINLRYSGGIAYTELSGINLPGIFSCRRLGIASPANFWTDNVKIKTVTTAIISD
tara:strand:- start:1599 stop:2591 length:993 start_codon:yes stop_codon:yes gene_type:complete